MTSFHINRNKVLFLALLLLSVSFGTVQAKSESFNLLRKAITVIERLASSMIQWT